mgnify:CR=1 FL=1
MLRQRLTHCQFSSRKTNIARCIAFHMAHDRQKVCIGLNRKRFEATLIDRSGFRPVVVGMPALRRRYGDPPQRLRQFSILTMSDQEVPVLGHQAVCGDANASLSLNLGQNRFERGIVGGCAEQRLSAHAMIQDVIGKVFDCESWAARHGRSCADTVRSCQ